MSYNILIWKESSLIDSFEAEDFYDRLCEETAGDLAPAPGLDACIAALKQRFVPGADDDAPIQWEDCDIAENYAILSCAAIAGEELAEIILNDAIGANLTCYDPQQEIVWFPCAPDDAQRALAGLKKATQGEEMGAVIFVADQEKAYYAQCAWFHEEPEIRLEVSGPTYMAQEDQLSKAQHNLLLAAGWNAPDDAGNYWRTHSKKDGLGAVTHCMDALRSVFRPEGDDAPIGLEFVSY